mmetsp:Transcript_76099/g.234921  ORF Transcript_76099/g.234921 Transcript_76099/m.234921 type:complete len:663 (+) Transcript_76099:857-2845(+)
MTSCRALGCHATGSGDMWQNARRNTCSGQQLTGLRLVRSPQTASLPRRLVGRSLRCFITGVRRCVSGRHLEDHLARLVHHGTAIGKSRGVLRALLASRALVARSPSRRVAIKGGLICSGLRCCRRHRCLADAGLLHLRPGRHGLMHGPVLRSCEARRSHFRTVSLRERWARCKLRHCGLLQWTGGHAMLNHEGCMLSHHRLVPAACSVRRPAPLARRACARGPFRVEALCSESKRGWPTTDTTIGNPVRMVREGGHGGWAGPLNLRADGSTSLRGQARRPGVLCQGVLHALLVGRKLLTTGSPLGARPALFGLLGGRRHATLLRVPSQGLHSKGESGELADYTTLRPRPLVGLARLPLAVAVALGRGRSVAGLALRRVAVCRTALGKLLLTCGFCCRRLLGGLLCRGAVLSVHACGGLRLSGHVDNPRAHCGQVLPALPQRIVNFRGLDGRRRPPGVLRVGLRGSGDPASTRTIPGRSCCAGGGVSHLRVRKRVRGAVGSGLRVAAVRAGGVSGGAARSVPESGVLAARRSESLRGGLRQIGGAGGLQYLVHGEVIGVWRGLQRLVSGRGRLGLLQAKARVCRLAGGRSLRAAVRRRSSAEHGARTLASRLSALAPRRGAAVPGRPSVGVRRGRCRAAPSAHLAVLGCLGARVGLCNVAGIG